MVREAASSDIDRIRALMNSIPGFWDDTWPPDVLERALGCSDTIALVHEDRGVIDGFVSSHDVGFRAYLSELAVSPKSQRRGIGSRLLAEVESRLADRRCPLIIADVWKDAEGFYRARGWTPPPVTLLRKRLAPR